jgi:hypothetical protein
MLPKCGKDLLNARVPQLVVFMDTSTEIDQGEVKVVSGEN